MAKISEETIKLAEKHISKMNDTRLTPLGIFLTAKNVERVVKQYFADTHAKMENRQSFIPYDH